MSSLGTSFLGQRRAYPRLPVSLPAQWSVGSDSWQEGEISNISAGGLFLRPIGSDAAKAPGKAIRMRFAMVGSRTIRMSGEIRWISAPIAGSIRGFGIEFDRVAPNLGTR